MTNTNTCIKTKKAWCRLYLMTCRLIFILLSLILAADSLSAQDNEEEDEVLVSLNIRRLGIFELPAIIKGNDAWLPVKDFFDLIKIRNIVSANFDSISGYIIQPKAVFLIEKNNYRVSYQGKVFNLKQTDLIYRETGLFLKVPFFGSIFGLDCDFNFRNLAVSLSTKLELPYIREMQQELMRKNLDKLKGQKKADTTLKKQFIWFQPGIADWAVSTIQQKEASNTSLNLQLGARLAGGDANIGLYYNNSQPFTLSQQSFQWRYVNNEHSLLRQISVGRIYTPTISSVYSPINGVQISNRPTTFRRSFGTYRISNTTEPGWKVELYINDVLVQYTDADAAGFYTFDVPLVYGNSVVKLRFFGPYGEELTKEENISIPFNFLPKNEFEYTVSAGIVADDEKSQFYRANFNYGVTKRITIGTGMEYLSSVPGKKPLPFVNASARLGSSLILTAEHTYGVKTTGLLNYRRPAGLQVDINYTKFDKSQASVKFNYQEDLKASLSIPIRTKTIYTFTRFTYNQSKLRYSTYKNLELLFSTIARGVVANVQTAALYNNNISTSFYTNLSLSFRVGAGIKFRPQIQYEYKQKDFSKVKAEVEKMVLNRAYMNFSYERNMISRTGIALLGFRINFSFVQAALSARQTNQGTSFIEAFRGSVLYNGKEKYTGFSGQNNIGMGGLILLPFLDINANGKRDSNEPRVPGLKLSVSGGRIIHHDKDTTIHITGLEAFRNYFIELDKNSFEDISWQIKNTTLSIAIEPNYLRIVEIPVSVAGEASGTVYLKKNTSRTGIGRVVVNFYDSRSNLVATTLTESDGYFSFLGFSPGIYTASVDKAQLKLLNLVNADNKISFTIKSGAEGAVIDGLEFELSSAYQSAPGK